MLNILCFNPRKARRFSHLIVLQISNYALLIASWKLRLENVLNGISIQLQRINKGKQYSTSLCLFNTLFLSIYLSIYWLINFLLINNKKKTWSSIYGEKYLQLRWPQKKAKGNDNEIDILKVKKEINTASWFARKVSLCQNLNLSIISSLIDYRSKYELKTCNWSMLLTTTLRWFPYNFFHRNFRYLLVLV